MEFGLAFRCKAEYVVVVCIICHICVMLNVYVYIISLKVCIKKTGVIARRVQSY